MRGYAKPPGDRECRLREWADRSAERRLGQVGDVALGAGQRHGQVAGVAVRQPVLHRVDRGDGECFIQLGDGHVGQPDSRDLAFLSQLSEGAHAFGQRHLRVDLVQLVQADPVCLKGAQADLAVDLKGVRRPMPSIPRPAISMRCLLECRPACQSPELIVTVTDKGTSRLDLPMCR